MIDLCRLCHITTSGNLYTEQSRNIHIQHFIQFYIFLRTYLSIIQNNICYILNVKITNHNIESIKVLLKSKQNETNAKLLKYKIGDRYQA